MPYFPNPAAEFIYISKYSRWIPEEKRRENWPETIDRYLAFIREERGDKIPPKVFKKIKQYMLDFGVLPSMRLLWSAGDAMRGTNITGYNCAFSVVDSLDVFSECLMILMCGCGFGFSVEKKYTEKLPSIPKIDFNQKNVFVIDDSKQGWADSVKNLMSSLYQGKNLEMDYSKIRPKGAKLKIMGGWASGPEPLSILHNFICETFQKAQERKLEPLEVHDIMCQIGEVVVAGGVRRSAMISLSDLDSDEMKGAKEWPFPMRRSMSNNSAVYSKKPTAVDFLKEWSALASSGTGERGIFNLEGAKNRSTERRNSNLIVGTNPCGEILLRNGEFCNLSSVVVRATDDLDDLLDKVECAAWMGVIQSTFTNFPYLSKKWAKNCEEERLIGISLSGQMDNPKLLSADALQALKSRAIKVAKKASGIMGINMPSATTTTKPEGTASQLTDSSSGVHPRFSKYYIRRYRLSSSDSLYKLMKGQGIKFSAENGQSKKAWEKAKNGNRDACTIYEKGKEWSEDKVGTWVVSFPAKSPRGSITRDQLSAIDQLEHYKKIQNNWAEHSTSCTIYVKDEEWFGVGNWVYLNWDLINGISFMPYDGGKYEQAPYEEITKEQYEKLAEKFPKIDYSKLKDYEEEDGTSDVGAIACAGDKCDI